MALQLQVSSLCELLHECQRPAAPIRAGHLTLMERRNGLPHAVVYALPEQDPAPDLGSLALPPPVQLEFAHPVAAADPAGSVFGAEGEEGTLGGGAPGGPGARDVGADVGGRTQGAAGAKGAGRRAGARPAAALAAGGVRGLGARAEEEAFALELGDQGPAASDVVRLVYSSLVTLRSTYDVNVRTGAPPARRPCLRALHPASLFRRQASRPVHCLLSCLFFRWTRAAQRQAAHCARAPRRRQGAEEAAGGRRLRPRAVSQHAPVGAQHRRRRGACRPTAPPALLACLVTPCAVTKSACGF